MKFDDATLAQIRAARPDESTWLAANAGSGKTRVLTDRVARLLLEGVQPENILCLTYTKAAASEMQNRLFKRLGAWAMLSNGKLAQGLQELGVDSPLTEEFLQSARTLFARAIETPGGLRIQTIHSFCAALLRRFPLEAGVSPQFREMEDRQGEMLRAEILERMADGPQIDLVRAIAPFVSGDDVESLMRQIAGLRDAFDRHWTVEGLRASYSLSPDETVQSIADRVMTPPLYEVVQAILPELKNSGVTDQRLADKLADLPTGLAGFERWCSAVLTQKGTVGARLLAKAVREGVPALAESFLNHAEHAAEAKQRIAACAAAERDAALHAFAVPFLQAYEREKSLRGVLDFDDLITRTRDLLKDPQVAAWVLYRLDGGIDHILVDEAQDTSPVQWEVIERLAQEFTSGEGARADVRRTIFVVGDKKQSIYSFQGADPSEFDRMRAEFAERLKPTRAPLISAALQYSFRSAAPILRLVDHTFDGAEASGFVADQKHKAFKDQMPGRVDLWPVVPVEKRDEDDVWYTPLDRPGARNHSVILAQRIAHFAAHQIGQPLPEEIGHSGHYQARPIHAGDFLILVRSRGPLFAEIIRACKQHSIPIAGADRLQVMTELAVKDVVALLQFLATPEDSLSLAAALRSPLFGLGEQALFDLAHRRDGKFLWPALRDRRDEFGAVMAVLDDLRGKVDFLRPYDLIERILTHHKGRQKLIGRLGQEAEEGINALLQQALAYEQSSVPSLTGFLEWAQTDDLEIKRAPDSAGRMLRVMTVHGAKGLEAPIVILPDCGPRPEKVRDSLLADDHGVFWKQSAGNTPPRQEAAIDVRKMADTQEQDRLLYVGLTRAEKWLVVAAAGELGKTGATWYDKVAAGMQEAGCVEAGFDFGEWGKGPGKSLIDGDWDALELVAPKAAASADVSLPDYFEHAVTAPSKGQATRSPSDLGGAKALPGAEGDSEEVALLRGTAIHHMLEWLAPLPQAMRTPALDSLQNAMGADVAYQPIWPLLPDIASEALGVLNAPALAAIFDQGLPEVPVTADLPGLGRLHGVIDRLVVQDHRVLAVDFKSNRVIAQTAEAVPEGLLRQMGAYVAALGLIYPGRTIETGVVWTKNAEFLPLPHKMVKAALDRATTP